MYATYDYYIGIYMGNAITSHDWARLEKKARDYIDYITMGKAVDYTGPELKDCTCAIAEQIQVLQAATAAARANLSRIETEPEKQSETVGPHSVTYRSSADTHKTIAEITNDATEECDRLAWQYLARTGLLYRGIPMR